MTEFEKAENKSVDSTVAYDVKSSSKTRYDEFRTNAMIWANSANTQVGDKKYLITGAKALPLLKLRKMDMLKLKAVVMSI